MQIAFERPRTAKILPFVNPLPPKNRLTMIDRIQAIDWNSTKAAPFGARLTIYDRQSQDPPEVGDYIGIYRADDLWAVWGVARHGSLLTVWHGPSGVDLGRFLTMGDALAAVPGVSIQPRLQRQG